MSRRRDLTLSQKIALLDKIKSKRGQTSLRSLATMLNIARTTIGRLIKQENDLRRTWASLRRGSAGKESQPDLDEALRDWHAAESAPGPDAARLRAKAEELARLMGRTDFQCTDRWLSRWRTRYGIQLQEEAPSLPPPPMTRRRKLIKSETPQPQLKIEPPDPDPEPQEAEPGRRPSRRAAREAAKKIYNTVRSYNCLSETDVPPAVVVTPPPPPPPRQTPPPAVRAPQQRRRPLVKLPPPDIDLVMECHEELLSSIQAEAMLQAQLQYNMVMKTLRNLKANNVRIICMSSDEALIEEPLERPLAKAPNIVTLQALKKEEPAPYPMELTETVPSPGTPILS